MRQINRLLLLVLVGFILAKGFVLQDGENSTEMKKVYLTWKQQKLRGKREKLALNNFSFNPTAAY